MNKVTKSERESLIDEARRIVRLDSHKLMCLNFDECVDHLMRAHGISKGRARAYVARAIMRARSPVWRDLWRGKGER
jgi:hypothetical protein